MKKSVTGDESDIPVVQMDSILIPKTKPDHFTIVVTGARWSGLQVHSSVLDDKDAIFEIVRTLRRDAEK